MLLRAAAPTRAVRLDPSRVEVDWWTVQAAVRRVREAGDKDARAEAVLTGVAPLHGVLAAGWTASGYRSIRRAHVAWASAFTSDSLRPAVGPDPHEAARLLEGACDLDPYDVGPRRARDTCLLLVALSEDDAFVRGGRRMSAVLKGRAGPCPAGHGAPAVWVAPAADSVAVAVMLEGIRGGASAVLALTRFDHTPVRPASPKRDGANIGGDAPIT